MSQQMNDLKPLFLSAEEAMGLLDLCLMSQAEFDPEKECALLKLSDLVRRHLAEDAKEACVVAKLGLEDVSMEPIETSPDIFRPSDNGRLPLRSAERVTVNVGPMQRAVSAPCPAWRFRSWATAPIL